MGSIVKRNKRKKREEGRSGKKKRKDKKKGRGSDHEVGSGSDLVLRRAKNKLNTTTRHSQKDFRERRGGVCAATIMPLEFLPHL
jgi:hypothetical protein